MVTRSQRHLREVRGYDSTAGGSILVPAISAISPDVATIVAAGVVNRVIASMSVIGGSGPIVFTVSNNGGLALNILGDQLRTNADPVGTVGLHTVIITATDRLGQTKSENINVTAT